MAKRAKRASTHDVVRDLIDRPPLNDGELGRRLQNVDRVDARRQIVDRIFDGSATREVVDLLAAALLVLGVEGQETRLERIVADVRRPRGERWTALSLVFHASPDRANRAMAGLHPADGLRLTLQPAVEAVSDVLSEASAGDAIAEALAALPQEIRPEAFVYLEEVRRNAGTPAVLAYRDLLALGRAADLRDLALDAIVEEGGAEAGAELIELRDEAADPGARQAFQRALLRLGTRAIEAPRASTAKGRAHMGICDGQGAFVVLGCFENADGTTSLADLCIRAHGEVRDGFAATSMTDAEMDQLFVKLEEAGLGDLAELSIGEAAAIVFAGLERTRKAEVAVPEDARGAILLFERARGERLPPPGLPVPPERGAVTAEEARALVSMRIYKSWFFDAGDLAGAGVQPLGPAARRLPRPPLRPPIPPAAAGRTRRSRSGKVRGPSPSESELRWVEGALAALERSEVAPRLAAMLAHMARWHALRGEQRWAEICAASRAEVERSFRASAVARAMVERSADVLRATPEHRTAVVGDPEARDRIRLELFVDVNHPKGRDLAVLDFTEAALVALTDALERLPGSLRPREDDLLRTAFAMAGIFTRWMIVRRRGDPEALYAEMEKPLSQTTSLDAEARKGVVSIVLPALASFVGEVCERCPVSCLTRPKVGMAEAFFSDKHPAFD
jgi:hypothetical protein